MSHVMETKNFRVSRENLKGAAEGAQVRKPPSESFYFTSEEKR